jgi:hypothetical protein
MYTQQTRNKKQKALNANDDDALLQRTLGDDEDEAGKDSRGARYHCNRNTPNHPTYIRELVSLNVSSASRP